MRGSDGRCKGVEHKREVSGVAAEVMRNQTPVMGSMLFAIPGEHK